jgi:hypothetical protein
MVCGTSLASALLDEVTKRSGAPVTLILFPLLIGVFMRMMVSREGLLLNVGLVFCTSLILMKVPVCEQISLHTGSTGDQTQNSLNKSPASYCDTIDIFSSN